MTERFIQKGEYVQLGAATVRRVNSSDIEARATAALGRAANIHLGESVSIRDHGRERRGHIRAIVPVGDDRSRQFEVCVVFENPEWLVGTSVEVSLPAATERTAITIPRDASVIRQNHSYVMRVRRANTVEELDVTPGIALADVVEVSGPLSPGDQLVTRGAARLSAGKAVKVIASDPHTARPALCPAASLCGAVSMISGNNVPEGERRRRHAPRLLKVRGRRLLSDYNLLGYAATVLELGKGYHLLV